MKFNKSESWLIAFYLAFVVKEKFPGPTKDAAKVTTMRTVHKKSDVPWKNDALELKQCWSKPESG